MDIPRLPVEQKRFDEQNRRRAYLINGIRPETLLVSFPWPVVCTRPNTGRAGSRSQLPASKSRIGKVRVKLFGSSPSLSHMGELQGPQPTVPTEATAAT